VKFSKQCTAVIVVFVVMSSWFASTASAQLDVDQLETDEASILAEQVRLDDEIVQLINELASMRDSISRNQVAVRIYKRDYAEVVETHRAAVAVLQSIAVQRFRNGNPLLDGLVQELLEERAAVKPAIERSLYTQIIDGRIAFIDELAQRVEPARESRDAASAELQRLRDLEPILVDAVAAARLARTASDPQLAALRDELSWERSLQLRSHLTGIENGTDNNRPVLAVKIDNVGRARPQAGINQADVVIEELVEGSLTRLIGLFHSTPSNPIGPIRSVRLSDVAILSNLNRPLLANSGANPGTMAALNNSPIIDIGALSQTPARFYRSSDRPAPANLFSTTDDLWAAGEGSDAGAAPALFSFRRPDRAGPPGAEIVSGVDIDFGSTFVNYRWSESRQGWLRRQDGSPHVDISGVQVAPTNLIVQMVEYTPTPFAAITPEAHVVGEGEAWVFSEGEMRRGRWVRPDLEAPTRFIDDAGTEIELLPGTTWIALAPLESATLRN